MCSGSKIWQVRLSAGQALQTPSSIVGPVRHDTPIAIQNRLLHAADAGAGKGDPPATFGLLPRPRSCGRGRRSQRMCNQRQFIEFVETTAPFADDPNRFFQPTAKQKLLIPAGIQANGDVKLVFVQTRRSIARQITADFRFNIGILRAQSALYKPVAYAHHSPREVRSAGCCCALSRSNWLTAMSFRRRIWRAWPIRDSPAFGQENAAPFAQRSRAGRQGPQAASSAS